MAPALRAPRSLSSIFVALALGRIEVGLGIVIVAWLACAMALAALLLPYTHRQPQHLVGKMF